MNKRWEEIAYKQYVLFFSPYSQENMILSLYRGNDCWIINSSVLGVAGEYLHYYGDDLNKAKEAAEEKIARFYESEADYYAELLSKFKEE